MEKRLERNTTKLRQALAVPARDLAEMLSVSPRTIWRLLAAGKLPQPKSLGRSKRFLMSDIRLFVEECDCDMARFRARMDAENEN